MQVLLKIIKKLFYSGHIRSIKANKNIALSFILKGVNIAIQFLYVPLLLGYLSPLKYGIWITIGSIMSWFYFFDIGLGHGLRNRLTEALSKNKKDHAKILVSTTYAILFIITIFLILTFILINQFISWQKVLNAPPTLMNEVNTLLIISFSFFSINFTSQLISSILKALQESALTDAIFSIGNVLSLLTTFILVNTNKTQGQGSIVTIGVIFGICTVLPSLIATFFLFNNKYCYLKPSFKCIDFSCFRDLSSLSTKFFIIQVASLVVFTTDNIIITQLFGPADVTIYSISQRYFSIITMLFSIITGPFWSAFTEAYVKNDITWIKNKVNHLLKIWIVSNVTIIILILFSEIAIRIWIGHHVNIPLSLTIFMGVFVGISTWNNIFTNFINGVGKIKLSVLTASINMIINIPLAVLFAKTFEMGISGVVFANCVSLGIGMILRPVQYFKIINNKDAGIWGK